MNGFFRLTLCALALTLLPACSMDSDQTASPQPAAALPVTNAPVEPPAPPPVVSTNAAPSSNAAPTPVPPTPSPSPSPEPRFIYSSVKVDGPYIAMTFDDGPNPKNTPKLLDLLAEKHIKATFFIVGENAARMPEIMKRIVAEGHEIGSHTWTHLNCSKSSDEKIRAELKRTDDEVLAETGIRPKLLRPPYGAMNLRQRHWIHEEFGYDIILWDVDPLDWKEPGVSVVAHRIITATHPGSIILSHDIHAPTITAMPEVFDTLLAKGYKFVTVSELIALEKTHPKIIQPEPAKVLDLTNAAPAVVAPVVVPTPPPPAQP